MLGNDISDETPPRLLVHISDIFRQEVRLERTLAVFPRLATTFQPDLRTIARYEQVRDKGLRIELFHYLDDGWPGQELFDDLDGLSHPFTALRLFSNLPHAQSFIDYSRDVRGVVDPLHPMAFGARTGIPFGL